MRMHSVILAVTALLAFSAGAAVDARSAWVENGTALCAAADRQYVPKLVSDGAGGAIAVWSDERTGEKDIYAQRVGADGTVLWEIDGIVICKSPDIQLYHRVTPDGTGGAIVVWLDYRSGYALYAQRVDAGGTTCWMSDGVLIAESVPGFVLPEITTDGAGGAIITWWDSRTGASKIYAQRIDAGGVPRWDAGGVCVSAAVGGTIPDIVPDGAGGAVITWYASSTIYAQRVDANGTLLWGPDAVVIDYAPGDNSPRIAPDGTGGAIAAWKVYIGPRQATLTEDYEIKARRVDGTGTVLWTGAVTLTESTWQMVHVAMATDGAGGAIITWDGDDIFAQRVASDGTKLWGAGGIIAIPNGNSAVIESDGAEGAVIACNIWGDGGIGTQRLLPGGQCLWGDSGIVACDLPAAGWPMFPAVTCDGDGGAIAAWQDLRSGPGDIYAVRINCSGNVHPTGTDNPPPVAFLAQNHPNPFNPATTIVFGLAEPAHVHLRIYDAAGRLVRVLADGHRAAGRYSVTWNGRDGGGRRAASGVYLYKLQAGAFEKTRKMVLLQ
jgi:hypothetical protein